MLITREQQSGDSANNSGNYPDAFAHYNKFLEASTKLGVYRNTEMEAQVCRKTSHACQAMGKFSDAKKYMGYAFLLDSINRNDLGILEDIRESGKIQLMSGDLLLGMKTLDKAVELSDGLEKSLKDVNKNANAEVHLTLAGANLVIGNFQTSKTYAEKALSIFTLTNNSIGQSESYLVLGSIESDLSNRTQALDYFQKSIIASEHAGINTARQYRAIGEVMVFSGEYEKALMYMLQAKNKADSSGIVPQIMWTKVGIGDVYRIMGDKEKANIFYSDALGTAENAINENKGIKASLNWRTGNVFEAESYFSSQGSKVATGLTLLRMGEIWIENSTWDSARVYFQKAKKQFAEVGINEGITRADLFLAETFLNLKFPENASTMINEAQHLNKNPDLQWLIYYLSGRREELIGRKDSAILWYSKSINEVEKSRIRFSTDEIRGSYMGNKMKVYDRLINLLLEKGFTVEALSIAEQGKARAFLDMLGKSRVGQKTAAQSPLISHEQELAFRIAKLKKDYVQSFYETDNIAQSRSSREILSDALDKAQDEYEQVLIQIKLNNPEYYGLVSIQPISIPALQSALPPSACLIEYWSDDTCTNIWIIQAKKIKNVRINLNSVKISNLVQKVRNRIESSSQQSTTIFQEAYNILFRPVDQQLDNVNLIGIIPHGSLHLLPFQALMDPTGKYLAEKYTIFYSPSASVYFQNQSKEFIDGGKLLGMALGNLDIGTYGGLPGTRIELERISQLWADSKSFFERNSTEEIIKSSGKAYQFIHLATHGFFNEDHPLYSFLLFSPTEKEDGQLTVNEVFNLSLNANLVVLSACQTGLGKISAGDEVAGLSRAFLYAGSRSVMVSLWSVADNPTATLMSYFYGYLKTKTASEALVLAEREVMKKWPQPVFWAPFQLIGNPMVSLYK